MLVLFQQSLVISTQCGNIIVRRGKSSVVKEIGSGCLVVNVRFDDTAFSTDN